MDGREIWGEENGWEGETVGIERMGGRDDWKRTA